jgi:aspartyl-tRNA(Asn)/glutamyl-tRNA(Gln) amidotransferase subunit A
MSASAGGGGVGPAWGEHGVGGVRACASAVREGRVSAEELARLTLARIDAVDAKVRAFLEVFHERALEQARAVDRRRAAGEDLGPLAGVPVALKDNIVLDYGKTTCGSRMLEQYRSPFSATVARRLIDAGAVIVGKTNCDEFAMGSSTERSAFGPTRNPWDLARVPGGSSGGSAAAVAAGLCAAALGSDTGGSIRQPASLCGIVGLKPTYGRVSRLGLVAYASSLDQIGPMTRDVGDAAIVLGVIAGHDPGDSTSHPDSAFDPEGIERPLAGLRLGWPREARSSANSAGTAAVLEEAVSVYRSLGAEVVDVELPHIDQGIAAYYIIAPAEASSNLARFDGVRYGRRAALGAGESLKDLYARSRAEGFGAEVQRRIMLGTHVLSSGYYDAYYTTALKVRRLIKGDYDRAFARGCQAIIMPASPGPAFELGAKLGDPLAMYMEDVYTVGVNLAGLPALSMPAGFERVGGVGGLGSVELPVGVQLVGPALSEHALLRAAAMFERVCGAGARRAPV